MMEDRIHSLEDRRAIHLLSVMARPHMRAGDSPPELSPELREALAATFGPAEGSSTEGEVARQALLVLAQDPRTAAPLQALLDGPTPERFTDFVQVVEIITMALVVLKLHVRVERTAKGEWKFLGEIPTTTEPLLKHLVNKLLGLLPGK